MKQILVPYNFSSTAENALDFACQVAEKAEGDIILLHVIEHPTADSFKTMGIQGVDPMEQLYVKKMYEKVNFMLADIVTKAKYLDDRIRTKIQLGNEFNTIIDQITEENVDLLIVGTEGAEGLDEFFVGSNTEKIVRKANCPVISVSDKFELEPIEKIVFASDFINTDDSFVEKVKALQDMLGAELKIVKINTPSSFTSSRHDMEQMNEFVEKYSIENFTTEIYNYKNEEDGIIYYAEDINADMIALGTHRRKGVGHFLAGSIAEDVVNHAKVPVWTAHLNT